MLSLINDIFDFSKIEARQLKLEHTAFDLQGVVESVIDILGVATEMKDVVLQFSRRMASNPQIIVVEDNRG